MNKNLPLYLHYKRQLLQSPVFEGLPDELLSNMLEQFHHTTWRKGVVADKRLSLKNFYLIIDGRIKVEHVDAESGKRAILFLLGSGDGFDVITLLDDQLHDATPIALDDLSLLVAPMQTVREWINCHPEFNRNFLPYLGERMRRMENLATDLSMKDTVTRLARMILHYTAPETISGSDNYPVKLIHDLSHESLADMIGSTRQVVNKHLQALRREGLLDSHANHLVVAELEMLKDKAGHFFSQKP